MNRDEVPRRHGAQRRRAPTKDLAHPRLGEVTPKSASASRTSCARQNRPSVKPKRDLLELDTVLDEVMSFVKLAKDCAYMAVYCSAAPHRTVLAAAHVCLLAGDAPACASGRRCLVSAVGRRGDGRPCCDMKSYDVLRPRRPGGGCGETVVPRSRRLAPAGVVALRHDELAAFVRRAPVEAHPLGRLMMTGHDEATVRCAKGSTAWAAPLAGLLTTWTRRRTFAEPDPARARRGWTEWT